MQPPVPYEHSAGATDVLVSIDQAGGHVPLETTFRNTSEFLLLGDRTAIAPASVPDSFPGPAIYPLRSVQLSEGRVQDLFRAAADAGLLAAEIEYGDPGWTDLAYTSVYIAVDGRTYTQSAYGLGYDDDTSAELSGPERTARLACVGSSSRHGIW